MSKLDNNTIATDTLQLSQLYYLQNLLFEIEKNLLLINNGAAGKTIVVNGANLFALAAQYYSDATLWTTIANANNLTDSVIAPGIPISIVIPTKTVDTGGALQL